LEDNQTVALDQESVEMLPLMPVAAEKYLEKYLEIEVCDVLSLV